MGKWPLSFVALGLVVGIAEPALAADILFEDVNVPATFPQVRGSPTWSLEAVVVRPDDVQRHPLAVFIDGTPEVSPRPMLFVARELARRGWVTVAVVRPGWGKSEGSEPPQKCENPAYEVHALLAAQTLRETIRAMDKEPYVDPSRAIAIGHSTGGVGAVALTADPPPNLVAAISFAGNNGSEYLNGKLDMVCNSAELVNTFAAFGRKSRVPMLWIYAENDHHMGPDLAQAYYAAFTKGGGNAVFEMAPPIGQDGHQLYSMSEAVPIWTAYLDKFLADQNLALISPPLPIPIPNISPPAGLTASGREGFARYLTAIPHKAFAMSKSRWGSDVLADSTEQAITEAMSRCVATLTDPCKPVMVDDKPVP